MTFFVGSGSDQKGLDPTGSGTATLLLGGGRAPGMVLGSIRLNQTGAFRVDDDALLIRKFN